MEAAAASAAEFPPSPHHAGAAADAAAGREHGRAGRLSEALLRRVASRLLASAGITVDGPEPYAPRVHSARAIARFLLSGTLGAGESYMEGEWDCDALDELTERLLRARLDERPVTPRETAATLIARVANFQTPSLARRNAAAHYDIGNELYEAMLGRTMAYSCGYWRDAASLDDAQDAKHDLICRKLYLKAGQRVLDVGCGFGGFARFAAERYGVDVVGVTNSEAQARYAQAHCAGLPVRIEVGDYRALDGKFDRVVSIGMFEHVGAHNHRRFFEKVHALLDNDGLALVQTIGTLKASWRTDPWINRHIFPHAVIPAASQITRALEALFHIEDWHAFGHDYDRTLRAWLNNFEAAWPVLHARHGERYGGRFRRMWRYYLLTCAGTFRARRNDLWQLTLSKGRLEDRYRRVT